MTIYYTTVSRNIIFFIRWKFQDVHNSRKIHS